MLLVVASIAVGSLMVQSEHIRWLTLVAGPAVDANNQILQAMTEAKAALNAYQVSGDRALLQPYLGAHDRTRAMLGDLEAKLVQAADGEADAVRYKAMGERQRVAAEQWWASALLREQALSAGERPDAVQSGTLFDRYLAANASSGRYLMAQRDKGGLDARTMSSRAEIVSITATVAALLAMLVLGRRVAAAISRPLTELRDTMVRQREGEPGARAREDQGSLELRSVAGDFNALTEQNVVLRQIHARDLGTNQVTLEIARVIRAASDTQQALDAMCIALGEGLGVDRVIARTLGDHHDVQLGAQWHRPAVAHLVDLTVLSELGGVTEDSWLSAGFRAQDDLLETEGTLDLGRTFHLETGARAVIMVPIGLDDRVIGMIYVLGFEPRAWTMSEVNVVQAVAGFVARAIGGAEHQAYQREYVHRIERLDRQKSDFLATVSHELRTPLTSIMGYLELLQENDGDELTTQQRRMLEVISRNTGRLRSLIEDVMVLSRIEGGVSKADLVKVSIHDLIARVGEELSLLAQGNAIELMIDPGSPAAIVLGDKASLDRAVVNILANAIKFSHAGGVVTLSGALDQDARRVLVTCQDHGVGIPAHDLADLFTRFFRASNATEQAIPGTGLGLSIAKQIVEEHHDGELRLTSVLDEGTTVVMDLPLYEPDQERSPAPDAVRNDFDPEDVFRIRA
jgi:signal transduction histidine kinase